MASSPLESQSAISPAASSIGVRPAAGSSPGSTWGRLSRPRSSSIDDQLRRVFPLAGVEDGAIRGLGHQDEGDGTVATHGSGDVVLNPGARAERPRVQPGHRAVTPAGCSR